MSRSGARGGSRRRSTVSSLFKKKKLELGAEAEAAIGRRLEQEKLEEEEREQTRYAREHRDGHNRGVDAHGARGWEPKNAARGVREEARGIARSTAAACVRSGRVQMRAAVTVQKNVRSVLNRKLVQVAQQGKQGRVEHFASTRIAVKWRVFRAKQDVARRRAERETEARVQARTALAIEAAAELLSAVARLQVGGQSGCSRIYTAAYTRRMACSMSMCTHQVGESERLVDIAGRPAAYILRRPAHYLVMNDNERLPERKVAFDKVAGLCSQFRLEGGEAGEAEAAERKTPGAKLQRRWSTTTPSAVERWKTQLDEKGRVHKDTEGEGEGEEEEEAEEAEEAEAVRQAVRRARGRRAKEALIEEATRKAVEEERFLVRQPPEEATRKVVETQAELRAVAAEAQAAGVLARAAVAEAEGRVDTAEAEGRVSRLESQASRSSLAPQHPSNSTVQLQQSEMVELGGQAGEGTEPDAAAPLAAAGSDVGKRAQEVARLEQAIATARDPNLLEPHEITVRPTRDSPALPSTARHSPTQPVGASGGIAGEEWTGCAKGCVVKGAVRHARGRQRRQSSRRASKKWRSRSKRTFSPPQPPALACWPRKRRRRQKQRQSQWKRKPRRRQRRRQQSKQQH